MSDTLNISWRRVYAYAVVAVAMMQFAKRDFQTGSEYLDIMITLICLVGMVCHVNHIAVFNRIFWQIWTPLALGWDIWLRVKDYLAARPDLSTAFKNFLPDFFMYLGPVYFFLFTYSYIHFPLSTEAVDDYD
jgi:hypothetical protein